VEKRIFCSLCGSEIKESAVKNSPEGEAICEACLVQVLDDEEEAEEEEESKV